MAASIRFSGFGDIVPGAAPGTVGTCVGPNCGMSPSTLDAAVKMAASTDWAALSKPGSGGGYTGPLYTGPIQGGSNPLSPGKLSDPTAGMTVPDTASTSVQKKGLPGWAWVAIGVGGLAVIGGVVYAARSR